MSRLPELDGGAILWRVFAHLSQLVKLHGHRHRDLARVAPVKILDLLQPATGGQKVILWAIMIKKNLTEKCWQVENLVGKQISLKILNKYRYRYV